MPSRIQKIPLSEIYVDEDFNCRDKINPVDVVELAKSIAKDGLISPIIVTPITEPIQGDYKYRIVAGFRRIYAHQINKAETIEAVIRENLSEKEARILNLTENLARHDLSILEEAKSILPLFKLGLNEFQIAEELPNCSRGWVQVRVMLLKLPPEVQKEAAAGLLTQTQIRDLYTLKNNGADDATLFEHVKQIKDAKIKNNSIKKHIPRKMPPAQSKRIRKKPDMYALIDIILENIGDSFGARCLAWAAGEISDQDIYEDIQKEAKLVGKQFTIPKHSI